MWDLLGIYFTINLEKFIAMKFPNQWMKLASQAFRLPLPCPSGMANLGPQAPTTRSHADLGSRAEEKPFSLG